MPGEDQELERYRLASQDALELLDWCIGYLHGIGKDGISSVLAKNRPYIRERLLERAPEPTPEDDAA